MKESMRFDQLIRVLIVDSITAFHFTEKCASPEAPGEFYFESIRILKALQSAYSLSIFSSRYPISSNNKQDYYHLSKEWTHFSTLRLISEVNNASTPRSYFLRVYNAGTNSWDTIFPFDIGNCIQFK